MVGWVLAGFLVAPARAAELKPNTVVAFDRYIRTSEARMAQDLSEDHFLLMDRLPDVRRQETYALLRQGRLWIEQLHTKENGLVIRIPSGLIHHWAGVMFIPGATLGQTLAVLQDYDHHSIVYKPDVRRSKLLERNGNDFKVYLQLYRKSLVTVVVNIDFDVHYALSSTTRAQSTSYSTRIAEVENPDKPDERELPVGNDHGYVWRLYNYWRIEEKDGGVYVQVESVGLSRSIPWIFAWLINPLIKSIPPELLSCLLNATRKAVTSTAAPSAHSASRLLAFSPSFVRSWRLASPCARRGWLQDASRLRPAGDAILRVMRSNVLRALIFLILLTCAVCPLVELFDRWDHTLQTGADTEYSLVLLALCLGVSYVAHTLFRFSPRVSASLTIPVFSVPEGLLSSRPGSSAPMPASTASRIVSLRI